MTGFELGSSNAIQRRDILNWAIYCDQMANQQLFYENKGKNHLGTTRSRF